MLIARGIRCTLRVSSTSFLNPSFSSIVATGNKPPYGVRFLPEKSKGVFAAILLGSEYDFREPCGTGDLPVCLERFITIWVTPGNGLAKVRLRGRTVLQQHFQGLQMVFLFTDLHSPQNCAYVRLYSKQYRSQQGAERWQWSCRLQTQ